MLLAVSQPARGMDWLERMVFMADDMLIVGFHGVSLQRLQECSNI